MTTSASDGACDSASVAAAEANIDSAIALRLPIRSARWPPAAEAASEPAP